ncbi:hypothetical protein SAMN02745248_00186 [Hathewaya proteolytica DSM 3090]|uniref:Uncharacterized protein n=1 Tax=Hathewaya proteolytica DSM 3090 TaxID=1121331 RepID=A0A1M6JGQ0_9CLOT|nr:hypothetical protein [Hathewaya proteolytica]SHJ45889.1 hypothetical protein SAMN02745248_00186 [Hathewaya proteolytica DSM 3090]
MKKIVAMIMVAVSVITLGYYTTSMVSANQSEMEFKDISGDRNVLKEDEIILSSLSTYTAYEQTIGKQGSSVKRSYLEAVGLGVTKEEFKKNKSFYRGFNWLENPIYEDDQYKMLISSNTQYTGSADSVINNINISYKDKSVGKVNRLKLKAPVKVNGLNPMAIRNVGGKINYVYFGNSSKEDSKTVIVSTTIDLKAGTIKKDKVIDVEAIFGKKNISIRVLTCTDKNIYILCRSYGKDEEHSIGMYAVDFKDYKLRQINANIEDIDVETIEKVNGEVLFIDIKDGKMIINKFNESTETVDKYKEIHLPKEYLQKSQQGEFMEIKPGNYIEFISIKDNKLYITATKGKENEKFIDVLDANNGNELYKCSVAPYVGAIRVE